MAGIAIIKLSALGDVLIASAAIQRIAVQHSGQPIRLLTAPAFVPLFNGWDDLEIEGLSLKDWKAVFINGGRLRRLRLQRVYDLQGNKRSRVLTWLSGAPERVGLWSGWPYTQSSALARRPRVHPWIRINSVLEMAAVPPAKERPLFPLTTTEHALVERWLSNHELSDKPLVLIHAGASARWQSKRWDQARFEQLAHQLTARGLRVIWVGGPDDRALNAKLAKQVGINACDVFSIAGLMALGQRARFAITNDSGPMHALAAVNLPVYSLFGPTDWQLSHALGQGQRVIHADVACSPCFKTHCPLTINHHQCMQMITVDDVLGRLQRDSLIPITVGTNFDIGAVSADD